MLIRKSTVKHSFGTTKFSMGATHLLAREFKGVSTEMKCMFWHERFDKRVNNQVTIDLISGRNVQFKAY
jgi:hypothetical protein